MRKTDRTTLSVVVETITALAGVVYLALQLFYGFSYDLPPGRFLPNVLVVVLAYAALTWMLGHPELINHLTPEVCTGRIRVWSLWMLRLEKLIFVGSLLVPCICDAVGIAIRGSWSALVILLMVGVAIYLEARILAELKDQNHPDRE